MGKSVALVIEGKHSEAIEALNKAIELNPRGTFACNNIGAAYGQKGNRKQAMKDNNKVCALNQRKTCGKVEVVTY